MPKKVEKWFEPGKALGWNKSDNQDTRIMKALKSRQGNALKAGRALQALSNVTKDAEAKRKAGLDARYLFRLHKKTK